MKRMTLKNRLKPNQRIFFEYVEEQLHLDSFRLFLRNNTFVKDGENECGGFFCENSKRVEVSFHNKRWFNILIHEFCHFLQWRDERVWYDYIGQVGSNFWNWIDGEDMSMRLVKQGMNAAKKLEHDCEKKALELTNEFDIEVDIENQIRHANAYVAFYEAMLIKRKWYDKSPYSIKEILKKVPGNKIYYRFDKPIVDLIARKCFNG